ncbi:MAG: hypothetical protein Fur0014_19340 [Rubrivivax sp.]
MLRIERETPPHSTGRGAAMFIESYGPPQGRAAQLRARRRDADPKSGSYPAAARPGAGFGGPMTGAMRSLM